MIQHVYENTSKAPGLDRVLVATDDRRILRAVEDFGGEAVLTSPHHASGTDRLAEVARKIKAEWVVNVQGDLPFIRPQTIARILRPLWRDRSIFMGTARTPIYHREEWVNPNVVKVVTDAKGFALYFSRAPIPYLGEHVRNADGLLGTGAAHSRILGYRHLGVYVYRRHFLLKFPRLRATKLEQAEGLEQLRALAHGCRIRVTDVDEPSVEVNTPEDLVQAEVYFQRFGRREKKDG